MAKATNNVASSADTASKAADVVKKVSADLVEVSLDAEHTVNVVIQGVRVAFSKGVATVSADIAKALSDAGIVK